MIETLKPFIKSGIVGFVAGYAGSALGKYYIKKEKPFDYKENYDIENFSIASVLGLATIISPVPVKLSHKAIIGLVLGGIGSASLASLNKNKTDTQGTTTKDKVDLNNTQSTIYHQDDVLNDEKYKEYINDTVKKFTVKNKIPNLKAHLTNNLKRDNKYTYLTEQGVHIVKGSIVTLQDVFELYPDIIVNAANEDLIEGSGVCGAIFKKIDEKIDKKKKEGLETEIENLYKQIGKEKKCPTGQAVLTGGNKDFPAVIHAVGPNAGVPEYSDRENFDKTLEECYESIFKHAMKYKDYEAYKNKYQTRKPIIAIPAISTDIFAGSFKEDGKAQKDFKNIALKVCKKYTKDFDIICVCLEDAMYDRYASGVTSDS